MKLPRWLYAAALAPALAAAGCRPSSPRGGDEPGRERAAGRLADDRRHDAATPVATAQPPPSAAPVAATAPPPPPAPAAPVDGRYQGRPIASTCSYLGADWLDRPDRDRLQQPERVIDALHLAPGATVADVGAGTGYFTVRLARRVAKVHATDVQPEMLSLLSDRLAREHLANVELHRAGEHDAALPEHCCDLVLLVDVYHELADPPAVMAGIRRALRSGGRLVLIEYRAEDPAVAIKPEHKMTLPQIRRELAQLGFHFVDSLEFLPEQRIVIFD